MMKNILVTFFSSFIFYSCISYDVEKVDCASIKEIVIVNKTSDDTIPRSIIIIEPTAIKEFCTLINSRTFAGDVEVKDHSGFFEIAVKLKNTDSLKFDLIHTFRYGNVIRRRGRYFRQAYLNDYIYDEFRKRK